MRHVVVTLIAFGLGIALMLVWPQAVHLRLVPTHPAPPSAASVVTPADLQPAADGNDGLEAWPPTSPTPEQVLYAQPRMLRAALADMTPRVPGKPNLYLLAFAGDGGEDVFRNEAEYSARLFGRRFGPSAHSLVLENNPGTLASHPLASWSNLESALDGLAKVMQPDQDILLLYITTHGSEDHTLLVDMDPLPLDQIDTTDLAGILAVRHFKWKVLVINACYSGGFMSRLHGNGTLLLTAARADRSSFGCGSESHITYFGHAWLVDALNHTDNFVDAFRQASTEISAWETRDKLTPSLPQIDIGSGIEEQLALWRKGIEPAAAVPFKPATSASRTPQSPSAH